MFSFLERYRDWRRRRFLETWAKKRAKGKWHYVPGFALYWSLFVGVAFTVANLIFGEPTNIASFTARLIFGFLFGLVLGIFAWRSNERLFLARSADCHAWGKEQADDPEKFDAEWRRDWQSMPHREVVDLTNLNECKRDMIGADAGSIISATISLAPVKYISGLYIKNDVCPLCLGSTDVADRMAASLHLTFEKLSNIGSCAWVHKECFESLPLRNDLPGFPA